ncbi:hypothetical protein [Streptomyces sp. UG1]|uniref:hypothetical protein n=1 Tax=Streptomyces sp. UG1 TaxID=3417652 RepID=UPI003CEC94C3
MSRLTVSIAVLAVPAALATVRPAGLDVVSVAAIALWAVFWVFESVADLQIGGGPAEGTFRRPHPTRPLGRVR